VACSSFFSPDDWYCADHPPSAVETTDAESGSAFFFNVPEGVHDRAEARFGDLLIRPPMRVIVRRQWLTDLTIAPESVRIDSGAYEPD
jgi:hypothetical protein